MNPQGRDGGGDRRGVPVRCRLPLLAGGALALVGGLYAGLVLLGLPVAGTATDTADSVAAVHGPVMVFGFVGTLVALERAVALGARWALLAPACSALGAVALLTGGPGPLGRLLLCVAGVVLLGVYAALWRRQATVALVAQAAGALCWYAAALLWAGGFPISRIIPWLAGFVVATIAGERLELAHLALVGRRGVSAESGFLAVLAAVLAGAAASLLWPPIGSQLWGLSLLGLVGWLAAFDVARHTVHHRRGGLLRRGGRSVWIGGYAGGGYGPV